ncbi:hypothetical protein MJ585_21080 [Klebsiella pneumoniae]|nr:hypothetical protein MJ585_21080 [Klebsiella pneumoniae]
MLNEELADKERQYSVLEEEWSGKASLSAPRPSKPSWSRRKSPLEQAKAASAIWRDVRAAVWQNSEPEKQLAAATSPKGKLCVCCVIK